MYADYNKTRGTMGLIEKELEKVSLYDFFSLELDITVYQRPYTWGVASANILFTDTYKAFRYDVDEYRMGSVILHKNGGNYNIVDG